MIQILPITDETKRAEFCAEHGIPSDCAFMTAADGDEILGSIAAQVENGELCITLLETPHEWMKDGLIKSILAYGDNRFAIKAKTALFEHETAFMKIGFTKNDEFMEIEISKVIHTCKH